MQRDFGSKNLGQVNDRHSGPPVYISDVGTVVFLTRTNFFVPKLADAVVKA